ncbi:hypothetical protein [uncultured Duncaniella sp.]|nr:hypothetical protein [uncultured Duncaniella sp.]
MAVEIQYLGTSLVRLQGVPFFFGEIGCQIILPKLVNIIEE